jgi:translation initiation factor 4A
VSLRDCQALVLAPTRELAQYIAKAIMSLGDFMDITIRACVGGTSVREDVRAVKVGVHVVVGTPGRVSDLIKRKAFRLDHVKMFTLDEADELLSR